MRTAHEMCSDRLPRGYASAAELACEAPSTDAAVRLLERLNVNVDDLHSSLLERL